MLHESQEEIKELRSRSGPAAHLYSQSFGAFSGVRNWERYYVFKETCLRLDCPESGAVSDYVKHGYQRSGNMDCPLI